MNRLHNSMTKPVSAMTDDEIEAAAVHLRHLRPLFVGLPVGTSLLEAALCKFQRRDPIAIQFMQSHEVAT